MMRLSLTLLCLAIPGLPQPLTIGVEGGVRLTRDPQIYAPIYDRSNSKPYLVGPMIGGFDSALEPPLTKSARPVGDTEKVAQEWLRCASGFERRAILPYQRATVSPQYWPFPAFLGSIKDPQVRRSTDIPGDLPYTQSRYGSVFMHRSLLDCQTREFPPPPPEPHPNPEPIPQPGEPTQPKPEPIPQPGEPSPAEPGTLSSA